MQTNTAPTKGNLMAAENTLRLSERGYEMLDKKRNILIREMMQLIEEAKELEAKIEETFAHAYRALEAASVTMGMHNIERFAASAPLEESVAVDIRSVMGVELPVIDCKTENRRPVYSFYSTTSALDEAVMKFNDVKHMTVRLTEIENSVYRLAMSIKKTQKRANALENITIPYYKELTIDISSSLEEKEREEYSRLKIIKKTKK